MNSFVGAPYAGVLLLNGIGQFCTLFHILILHEIKYDVAFCRIGIEAGITFTIVLFIQDNGILSFGNFQVLTCACHTQ